MSKKYDIVIDGVDDKDMELLPYFDFEPVNNITTHISLIKDTTQRNHIKTMIVKNCNGVPSEIAQACRCLSDYLSSFVNPINSYNYYYRTGNDLWCYFSYPTDDFCVHIHNSDIVVYGEIYNLCRVIKDILMVSSEILPLHAASMSINNKGFCLVGDSQVGKTYFVFNLLKQGFRFISDDVSFVSNGNLINVDREIWVRKDMLCNDSPFVSSPDKTILYVRPQYVSEERSTKLHKVFVLCKIPKTTNSIIDLHSPFPIVPLQSYWCSSLLNILDFDNYINKQVERSINYWDEVLKRSVNIVSNNKTVELLKNMLSQYK